MPVRVALLLALCTAASCQCDDPELVGIAPLIAPDVTALDFGEVYVGASAERTVTVSNVGTADLTVTSAAVPNGPFNAVDAQGTAVLGPDASMSIVVRFVPVAAGTKGSSLLVASDAANGAELRIALTGVGLAALDCESDNPCVALDFDAVTGSCTETFVDGPCEDDNPCTSNTVCTQGQCLGEAVVCPAANDCEVGACSVELGCISVPDPGACDDDNPCTENVCDAVLGCSYTDLPNGVPCGPVEGCGNAPVCFAGECTDAPVPNGFPCFDGDLCTIGDECVEGACVGVREEREPEVVGTVDFYGTGNWLAQTALALSESRLLFAERRRDDTRFVLVSSEGSELEVLDDFVVTHEVGANPIYGLHLVDDTTALAVANQAPTLVFSIDEPAAADVLTQVGASDQTAYFSLSAVRNGIVYGCGLLGEDLHIVDVRIPSAPAVSQVSLDIQSVCQRVATHSSLDDLYYTTNNALYRRSLADPLAPGPAEEVTSLNGFSELAAGDGFVAHRPAVDFGDGTLDIHFPGGNVASLIATAQVAGIYVRDARLYVDLDTDAGALMRIYDMSVPVQPALLAEGPAPFGNFETAAGDVVTASQPRHFVFRRNGTSGYSQIPGKEAGAAYSLISEGLDVLAFAPRSVRRIAVSVPEAPTVLAGGRQLNGQLYDLPGAGRVLHAPYGDDRRTHRLQGHPLNWLSLEASVEAPAALGSIDLDGVSVAGGLVDDGTLFAVGVDDPTGAEFMHLWTFDLAGLSPGFDQTLAPLHDIAVSLDEPVSFPQLSLGQVPESERIVTALSNGPGFDERTTYAVWAAPTDQAPQLEWTSTAVGESISGFAVADGLVATITTNGTGGSAPFTLRISALAPDGSFALARTLELPTGDDQHILAFDGRTVFVSTPAGVTFIDVGEDPPVVLGAVDTVNPPTGTAFAADSLVTASEVAVQTITPPCPPPAD